MDKDSNLCFMYETSIELLGEKQSTYNIVSNIVKRYVFRLMTDPFILVAVSGLSLGQKYQLEDRVLLVKDTSQ